VLALMSAQQAFHQQNAYATEMSTGLTLANELRELTLELPQHDPIYGSAYFGPEPDEINSLPHVAVQNYDDLDDFAGSTYSGTTFDPPINALRQSVPNMAGWSQIITVENVGESNISGAPVGHMSTDLLRLTVQVMYQAPNAQSADEVTRLTWVTAGHAN
jgi:hypothetical protein